MSTRPAVTPAAETPVTEQKPAATQQGSFMFSLNDGPVDVSGRGKTRINSFNVILAAMAIGSLGMIMGMRQFGLKTAQASADLTVDATRVIEDPTRVAEQDRAIARLDAEQASRVAPVSAASVAVTPFFEPPRQDSKTGVSDPNDLSARAKAEAARKLEERANARKTALSLLKLESILNGSKPVARINKETVAVGDTVNETFVVTAIKDRSVELTCDGEVFVLELGAKVNSTTGKKNSKTNK